MFNQTPLFKIQGESASTTLICLDENKANVEVLHLDNPASIIIFGLL